MKFSIRFRLVALGIAVVLMGALIVFITLNSEREVSELQGRLNAVASESSEIVDQFKDSVRKLNNALLRYGTERDPAIWGTSLQIGNELNQWIQRQKTALRTQTEMDLLQKIQTAYAGYTIAAENFHSKIKSLDKRSAPLADFEPIRQRSQRLLDLGQSLARAHYQSHDELLRRANLSLEKLHFYVLILLALLFVLGAIMAVGVYRHLIAPLRVKLMETQAFAKRHEKLASLGLLASDVANGIRNPLTSIKIGMFVQKKKFQPGTSEWEDAEVVEREILRLEHILDNFLAHAQTKPI